MTSTYSISIVKNIYKKPSIKSGVESQILYGEKFKIIKKKKNWLKIKTENDNYKGYIKNNKYKKHLKLSYKCYNLKTKIFSKPNTKSFIKKKYLTFNSRIPVLGREKQFIEFEKNKWVLLKDLKPINHKEKKFFKILKKFINCRYLWGGKSFSGLDCSALIQLYYIYNNKFFPRDTKDQINFKKGKYTVKNFMKGNIIYWKGHVAICINSKKLIHAYGPKKKVIIMDIKNTIKVIKKTACLEVKKITKI